MLQFHENLYVVLDFGEEKIKIDNVNEFLTEQLGHPLYRLGEPIYVNEGTNVHMTVQDLDLDTKNKIIMNMGKPLTLLTYGNSFQDSVEDCVITDVEYLIDMYQPESTTFTVYMPPLNKYRELTQAELDEYEKERKEDTTDYDYHDGDCYYDDGYNYCPYCGRGLR